MKSITVDTNTVDDSRVAEAARQAGFDIARTTVTDHELESSSVRLALPEHEPLHESLVLGEGRLGSAVPPSDVDAEVFESLLQIISNGSFPSKGGRSGLSPGEKRQLRDAIILATHTREGREIFVSNDERAFIRGGRRQRLQHDFGVQIMTVDEFLKYCESASAKRFVGDTGHA